MSEWPTVQLADVLTRVKRPVTLDPEVEYVSIGVRWYGAGVFVKAPQAGAKIAAKTLNRVEAGDVVYSKLFAWKGSFGVVGAESAGSVASNEFPTYRATADLVPEYFVLWAARSELWDTADAASVGSTANSRNRLSEDDFLELEIGLPDLDDQRRIVAALTTLSAVVTSARDDRHAADIFFRGARRDMFERLIAAPGVAMERIGDLTKVSSGGTPSRSELSYFGGDIPWVKTGEVAFCEIGSTEETITEAGLKNSSAKLVPAMSVLVAMYGRGTVGRSALITKPMTTNQACAAIHPSAAYEARFLYHWLWDRYDELVDLAEGTTNLTNISKEIVEDFEMPGADKPTQARIVGDCQTLLANLQAADALVQRAEALVVAARDDLLSGARRAPLLVAT